MDIVNSAKALIIDHDKMAFLRIRDRDKVYYVLPGGSQKSEELLSDTVKRECIEELGVEIEVKELLFVSEGLTREAHHRVDFVFRCEVISEHIQEISQPDDNQCGTELVNY